MLSNKQDRYDGAQITLRKELKRGYPVVVAYTRSRATSNQTVDFAIDALLMGNQVGGALPWDAPNQLDDVGDISAALEAEEIRPVRGPASGTRVSAL